jgi:hypothetical protein
MLPFIPWLASERNSCGGIIVDRQGQGFPETTAAFCVVERGYDKLPNTTATNVSLRRAHLLSLLGLRGSRRFLDRRICSLGVFALAVQAQFDETLPKTLAAGLRGL